MVRRSVAILGGLLAGLGFLAALASLTQPWASYRVRADGAGDAASEDISGTVPLVELDRGWWYLAGLFALLALLAGAVAAPPRAARWVGLAAAVLALAGLLVMVDLANRLSGATRAVNTGLATMDVRVDHRTGIWFGLAAAPLLGFGAAMLSIRRRPNGSQPLPN